MNDFDPLLCPIFSQTFMFLCFLFLKAFPFILSQSIPFFWWSSKCSISQNIWFLIKTTLKHCTLTIFQGSSPWATLIPNSMIVVWVLYCVQLFLSCYFFCLFLKAFAFWFFINQFHSSDEFQNAQFPKIYDFLLKHH